MTKVLVVPTSIRTGRASDGVLKQVTQAFEEYPNLVPAIFDFAETPLPFFNEATSPAMEGYAPSDGNVKAWIAAIEAADHILLLSAEYNHSYTAVLKNAIDWVSPTVIKGKPVSFIGYGFAGGQRAIAKTRLLLTESLSAVPSDIEGNLFFTQTVNFDGTALDEVTAKSEIKKVLAAV